MKRLLSKFLILTFVATGAATADQHGTPGDQFQKIISAQMGAFARDDGEAAFAYAAPSIQQQFGSPGAFMAMVRSGFQPVYRPQSVEFDDHLVVDGNYAQPVRVVGPDGEQVLAMYHMELQPDGSWRIAGVVLRALRDQKS